MADKLMTEKQTAELIGKTIENLEFDVEIPELPDISESMFDDITVQEVEAAFTGDSSGGFKDLLEKVSTDATQEEHGLMSAADKKRLDGINDITTGINLLRGTRDFTSGTIPLNTTRVLYEDGFTSGTWVEKEIDEDGFTAVSNNAAKGNDGSLYSSRFFAKPNDEITVSFDVRLNEAITGSFWVAIYRLDTDKSIYSKSFSASEMSSVELNKWSRYKFSYVIKESDASEIGYAVVMRVLGGMVNSYRMVSANVGKINNPVWSASPFDINSAEYGGTGWSRGLNSGINLIRNTAYLLPKGDVSDGKSYAYNADVDYQELITKDVYGTTVCRMSNNTDNVYYLSMPYVEIDLDTYYTFSAWVKIESGSYDGKSAADIYLRNEGKTSKAAVTVSSTAQTGKWVKIVKVFRPSEYTSANDVVYANAMLFCHKGMTVSVKQPKLEKGIVLDPDWSANPSDIVNYYNMQNASQERGYVKDLDNISDGFHSWNPDTLNRPGTTYGIVHQWSNGYEGSNRWAFQFGMTTANPPVIVFRSNINAGGWSSWNKLTSTAV